VAVAEVVVEEPPEEQLVEAAQSVLLMAVAVQLTVALAIVVIKIVQASVDRQLLLLDLANGMAVLEVVVVA
jgi:hypothetical protein